MKQKENTSTLRQERNTKHKRTVISVFMGMRNHPSAEMVCDEVAKIDSGIGRATVYRVLNSLVEKGQAIKLPTDDGTYRYDITIPAHCHAKCRSCGSVTDIMTDGYLPRVVADDEFYTEGGMVLFFGLCKNCKNKN